MRRACSSRQQRQRGCGSEQRACVWQQAAAAGGTIAMNGRQPACMRQKAADAVCMRQHAVAAACVQQCAAAAAYVWQRVGAASSMIAMETVMAAANRWHNCNGWGWRQCKGWQDGGKIAMDNSDGDWQLWVKAGVGGCSG